MEGFALLCGHLVGDYIVQNDWMAKNKVNPHPSKRPIPPKDIARSTTLFDPKANEFCIVGTPEGCSDENEAEFRQWEKDFKQWESAKHRWMIGHLACLIHCICYTVSVWAFSFWWMTWWGLLVCFILHFPIDRFRLAGWWMKNVSGQAFFASEKHPLFPWSIVVVDNIFHLVTLFGIAAIAGRI